MQGLRAAGTRLLANRTSPIQDPARSVLPQSGRPCPDGTLQPGGQIRPLHIATSGLQPGRHQRLIGAQKWELIPGLPEHGGRFVGCTGGERAVRADSTNTGLQKRPGETGHVGDGPAADLRVHTDLQKEAPRTIVPQVLVGLLGQNFTQKSS